MEMTLKMHLFIFCILQILCIVVEGWGLSVRSGEEKRGRQLGHRRVSLAVIDTSHY